MMDYSMVKQAFIDNGGILRTAALKRLGLHSRQLVELQAEGRLTRLKWGVYELTDGPFVNDADIIRHLIPNGIFCLHSALFCHGYTDRTPAAWDIAVDRDGSKTGLAIVYPPIKVYFSDASLLQLGATEGDIGGSIVPVYDRDSTVCDVLRGY